MDNKVLFLALILIPTYIALSFNYLKVGDLLGYEMDFHRTCKENLLIRWDFGYVAYQCIASKIMSFNIFLAFNTVICILIKFYRAKYKNINIIFYLLIFLYTFELQQLKAAICSSVLMLAYITFDDRKKTISKLVVASSFHLSSALLLIFLLIKRNIFTLILIILAIIFFENFIMPRFFAYISENAYLSPGRISFIIATIIILDMKNLKNKIFILYPSIFYLIAAPILGVIPHRFYFLIYPIVIYNLVLILIEDKSNTKKIISSLLIGAAIINTLI